MSDKEWLAGLKVGDEVMLPPKSSWDTRALHGIAKVESASAAYLIVGGRKFHRADGRETGTKRGEWPKNIRPVTFDDRDGDRRRQAKAALRSITGAYGDPFRDIPTDRIEQAVALLRGNP